MKEFIIDTISRLDLFVWLAVILFFCGSALLFNGNVQMAFIGSGGIIFEMLLIGISIEIIIETLKNTKGIGTITGFITNGPEAVCLLVGLFVGDIIFASSTPLGSNFMNPVLLAIAGIVCGQAVILFRTNRLYAILTISITSCLAVLFYALPEHYYPHWLIFSTIATVILFFKRPDETPHGEPYDTAIQSKIWLLPALCILIVAGYFLDSVVNFAAEHSHAPKGLIGFLVLSTLTSWPEFKSSIALLNRNKPGSAILNITVSNITNIWLAIGGIAIYLLTAL